MSSYIRTAIECAIAIATAHAKGQHCTKDTYERYNEALVQIEGIEEVTLPLLMKDSHAHHKT
jgi:uncharacterized secreted protein with C-terminal beta-propeller domain